VMTLAKDRDSWSALVAAARRGDADAWPPLIDRFEDFAVAAAVGLGGDLDEAQDIAQEAFALAFRHLGSLDDPTAFPAWLLRLIRTAAGRRTRRLRPESVPLDAVPLVDVRSGPEDLAVAGSEASQVRAAVEQLPEGERCVVALHYLAGLPYAEVATFLGISVSAAKKRGWSARARLKELLPMVTDTLAAVRPSGTEVFRDTILLFHAIRTRDADALARLLERDPSLATATEDWTPTEGFDTRLGFAVRGSALIRAAGTGEVRLVRLLVEAGAPVADLCPCVDHESALITAVTIGANEVVDYLLEQGGPVDSRSFDGGSTALHVAVHREHHDLVRRLLAAGADPDATDANGRTAADWSALKAERRQVAVDGDVLWTRLRSVDLFAPLRRGALVQLPPAYGVGAVRAQFGIVDALAPAEWWMIGFEHGPFEPGEFEKDALESGTSATIDLVPPGDPTERRRRFAASLERLATTPGRKVVTCIPAFGHEHDITVALPSLAADPSVLVTFVSAVYSPEEPVIPEALPEGFDARLTFNRPRANARLHPAIQPHRTSARHYPDDRHERLAAAAREMLAAYERLDRPFALPDPLTFDDPAWGTKAQALVRYLAHSFRPFELRSAEPASDATIAEVLDAVEALLES
jgi:RNA polymerase sigma-70 factor (ECF subfamily)